MVLILIFAALAALAIGAGVAFFFIGKHAGKNEFMRYIRKNPKPIGEEEYFGISKEIDRRIGSLKKWISSRKDTKADVSVANLELMKLYDIRQYLALTQTRDRAAARLYANAFLKKRQEEIYDLYAELYGLDVAQRTFGTQNRQQPAGEPSAGASSSETSEGAAAQAQTTAAATPNAAPAPTQSDGTAAQPAPAQPAPAPTETTTDAPNAPNGGK